MRSFLIDAVVEFAGSVADGFIEFLFAPNQSRSPPSNQYTPSPPPESPIETESDQTIQSLRSHIEDLQDEVDCVRDTMDQAMVILQKPCEHDVDRVEFLATLWKSLNQRDQIIARNGAIMRTLQKEVTSLLERQVELAKANSLLHAKMTFYTSSLHGEGSLLPSHGEVCSFSKFMEDKDDYFRQLQHELAVLRVEKEALVRQNRGLLEKAATSNLTTLRLARSAEESKRTKRRRRRVD